MIFSIIMPIYNVERYLEQSIHSVLSQSFKDFELILINDASPDKCKDICQAFSEQDSRVRLVNNKHNLGVCASRNIGIDLANGDWIWFVDPDDKIYQNSLKVLYDNMSSDLDVIFFGFQYVIETSTYTKRESKKSMPVNVHGSEKKDIAELLLKNDLNHTFSPLWNKIYSRSFINQNNIAFSDTTLEDTFFNLSVFSCTNRIKTIEECLYSYLRRKSGSLSKQKAWNRLDVYKKRHRAFLYFLRHMDGLTKSNHAKAFYCYFSRLFYVMYVAIVSKK